MKVRRNVDFTVYKKKEINKTREPHHITMLLTNCGQLVPQVLGFKSIIVVLQSLMVSPQLCFDPMALKAQLWLLPFYYIKWKPLTREVELQLLTFFVVKCKAINLSITLGKENKYKMACFISQTIILFLFCTTK